MHSSPLQASHALYFTVPLLYLHTLEIKQFPFVRFTRLAPNSFYLDACFYACFVFSHFGLVFFWSLYVLRWGGFGFQFFRTVEIVELWKTESNLGALGKCTGRYKASAEAALNKVAARERAGPLFSGF